jgi:hypothetical protein
MTSNLVGMEVTLSGTQPKATINFPYVLGQGACCGTTRPLARRAAYVGAHCLDRFLVGGIVEWMIGRGALTVLPINGNTSDSLANMPVAKFRGDRSKVLESHLFQSLVLCCLFLKLLNVPIQFHLTRSTATL